jgi:hypothetical protein
MAAAGAAAGAAAAIGAARAPRGVIGRVVDQVRETATSLLPGDRDRGNEGSGGSTSGTGGGYNSGGFGGGL